MPNDHKGGIRGFYHFAESWYAKSSPRDREDSINIGIYFPHEGGGSSGEFAIEWVLIGETVPVPQLQVFDDAWNALALFGDMLAKMAEAKTKPSLTPLEFCDLLRSCGIKDLTKRQPEAGDGPRDDFVAEQCRKCGGEMLAGKAMVSTFTAGLPDFPGDKRGITMSPGGPGSLVDCMKCRNCGWSVSRGSEP